MPTDPPPITDEQIRELRDASDLNVRLICDAALDHTGTWTTAEVRKRCRERCSEIIQARSYPGSGS